MPVGEEMFKFHGYSGPCPEVYSDLKLIDELLCNLKYYNESWVEVERKSAINRIAMRRLRQAYASGEMPTITLSLAKYFEETPS